MPEYLAVDAALNWIWQGCSIALAAAAALRLLGRARAGHRFVLCAAALFAVLVLPLLPLLTGLGPPAAAHGVDAAAIGGPVLALPRSWWTSPAVPVVALAAWLSIHGVRLIGALLAVRRLRAGCVPFPVEVEARLAQWRRLRGSGRQARLALTPGVRAAAVLGCGRPVIALAPPLLARLTPTELDDVIVHEWAHVQRRDEVIALAQLAVRAAAGWHPAVWWLDRQMGIEREAACDEAVVELTGSRKRYAASLVGLASLRPAPERDLPLVAAIAPAGLEARVHRVLGYQRLAPRGLSAGTVAAGLVLLAGLSLAIAPVALVETATKVASGQAAAAAGRDTLRLTETTAVPAAGARAAARGPGNAKHSVTPPVRRPQRSALTARAAAGHGLAASPGPLEPAVVAFRTAEPDGLQASGGPVPLEARAIPAPPMTRSPAGITGPAPPASPWRGAAEAGRAIGRGSKRAAETTSGVFTRFGKKLAASF